jgi:transposase
MSVMTEATKRRYSTDLTDEQWVMIQPLVDRERQMGRPTVIDLREVVNALLYLTRTGFPWRLLPTDFRTGTPQHCRPGWGRLGAGGRRREEQPIAAHLGG